MIRPKEFSRYSQIVKRLIGESVSIISHCQYFFNEERDNEDSGDVEIQTDSGLKICLKLLGDGESVGAYSGELIVPLSFEIGDGQRASWQKHPLNNMINFAGKKIVGIDAICNGYQNPDSMLLAGWQVKFDSGEYFVYYNCDDSARILFNEQPNKNMDHANIRWQPV